MMKRKLTPYLFLIFSLVVLYDAYEAVIDLIDFDFSSIAGESLLYRAGVRVGLGARVLLYLGVSFYAFYRFLKSFAQPAH